MALVHNDLESLYGGVNQQSAENRISNQVEEMVNAYPTIDKGLLRRNPTSSLNLKNSIDYNSNMWTYEYDRGLSGDSEEKYSISITDEGMQIVDVISGTVYNKENKKLLFEDNDDSYIKSFVNGRGYAAVTVKDTTFITNKNISPKTISVLDEQESEEDIKVKIISKTLLFLKNPAKSFGTYDLATMYQKDYAPSSMYIETGVDEFGDEIYNAAVLTSSTTTINIDGKNIVYEKPTERMENSWYSGNKLVFNTSAGTSYEEYIDNLLNSLSDALDQSIYEVIRDDSVYNYGIKITKIDGSETLATSVDISFGAVVGGNITGWTSILDDYYAGLNEYVGEKYVPVPVSKYLSEAYIWIQSSNPSTAYTYTYTIESSSGSYSGSVSNTTTEGAATNIVDDINNNASKYFVASSTGGSVLRVQSVDDVEIKNIYVGDSYGDQASFGWSKEVITIVDLPKNMPYENALVKVIGSSNTDTAFWLTYTDGQWRETLGYKTVSKIDKSTMPHTLTKNEDDTFTLSEYEWDDKLVGDDDSNEQPSFTQDNNTIKDIFFFKNRLGFITNRTVVMSEVGKYSNFWSTSVVAVLDSDRIDTAVDTTKAIQLEYVTYLEDNLMLFSDKSQFKLSGGAVLSPKDIQISQTSAYEINKNVRPIFMNNKIFFCAKRGEYTAVMQYSLDGNGRISDAIDITAHVQSYIPNTISKMSGSPINNMLFLVSNQEEDKVYVYKYYDNGDKRIQSAWFKWQFSGKIYNAFSLGKNLNILLNKPAVIEEEDWVVGSGIWDDDKLWNDSFFWVNKPEELLSVNKFDVMEIVPKDYLSTVFLDNGVDKIDTNINLGEWVFSVSGTKDIRGTLQFKTIQINSEDESEFDLIVENKKRNTTRTVKSKYTVNREPMVYGNSKDIRVSLHNDSEKGFRISTVSYEGILTQRSTRR